MITPRKASRIREALAFRAYDGLQILWGEEDHELELEFIPEQVLQARSSRSLAKAQTAALTRMRGLPRAYRYPVELAVKHGELHLSYHTPPVTWPPNMEWALVEGTTIIRFAAGTRRPTQIEWRADGEEPILLDEGPDWEYRTQASLTPIEKERAKIPRMVTDRPDQAWLRAALLAERPGCQVSSVTAEEALEACHILQVKDKGDDDPRNALLMRRDLHALFDRQLLRFEEVRGGRWEVRVSDDVADPVYQALNGKVLLGYEQHAPFLRVRAALEQEKAP